MSKRKRRGRQPISVEMRWIAPVLAWWHAEMALTSDTLEEMVRHRRTSRRWLGKTKWWILT